MPLILNLVKYFAVLAFHWKKLALAVEVPVFNYTSCADFPKAFPKMQDLVENSPFTYHYSLTQTFSCSKEVFLNPPKGKTGYTGTSLLILKDNIVVTYDFSFNTTEVITSCATGGNTTAYMMVANFTKSGGGFFCAYQCGPDEISLSEFKCGATDDSYIPDEMPYINSVINVPPTVPGNKVVDIYSKCVKPQYCKEFA